MNEWNVETIRDLLLEAGRIGMRHFSAPETVHKSDASLLTVADGAIEDFLTAELAGDDATVVGEERVDGTTPEMVDAALHGATWVIDPIDGTAPYANRLPNWGVSIGLLRDGAFTHGAWFLPRLGEMYITDGDEVLFNEESRDPPSWDFTRLQPLTAPAPPFSTTGMISLPHDVVRNRRFTGKNPIQSIGSAVYAFAQLLRGRYIGCITSLKLWDIAGAVPMLRRRGYHIRFSDGRELGDTVSATDWDLDAASARLWKARGALYVAHSEETLSHLQKHYRDR